MPLESPDPFALQEAEPRDAPFLAAVASRAGSGGWSAADFRNALKEPRTTVLLARPPGPLPTDEPIGYVVFRVVIDEMEILDIAVLRPWRRRGVGRALLDAALQRGTSRGARRAYLEVRESNTAAQGLYERFGFQIHSRRAAYYRDPVEDAIVLRRENRPELLP